MKTRFWLGTMGTALYLAGCGGDVTSDEAPENVQVDAATAAGAQGSGEVRIRTIRGGRVVDLTGAAATELFDLLGAAGFESSNDGGSELRLGTYVGCLSRAEGDYCQVVDTSATTRTDGFLVTIHGRRFGAGASELFGALAAAQGRSPNAAQQFQSGRFLCERSGSNVWCGLRPAPTQAELALRIIGLEPVGPDYVYEGWLITPNGPITSGRFDVRQGDESFSFEVPLEVAKESSTFVLTIEPAFGDDPAPAATHVLAGDFSASLSTLSVQHPAAFGQGFGSAKGQFILGTPSSAATDDAAYGIWFVDPTAGPGPSLDLPTLPEGWVYEGWVAGPNGPVSTGRFLNAAGADQDRGGPAAGPENTPPFPGQDFIDPAMFLPGLTAVISVEPEPDNSPLPFALKPLVGEIADRPMGVLQPLANQSGRNNPRGLAGLFDERGRPL
jgi:hypothetical protein